MRSRELRVYSRISACLWMFCVCVAPTQAEEFTDRACRWLRAHEVSAEMDRIVDNLQNANLRIPARRLEAPLSPAIIAELEGFFRMGGISPVTGENLHPMADEQFISAITRGIGQHDLEYFRLLDEAIANLYNTRSLQQWTEERARLAEQSSSRSWLWQSRRVAEPAPRPSIVSPEWVRAEREFTFNFWIDVLLEPHGVTQERRQEIHQVLQQSLSQLPEGMRNRSRLAMTTILLSQDFWSTCPRR